MSTHYISKANRYLRQFGCFFSFSLLCVREIEKVKIVKTRPKGLFPVKKKKRNGKCEIANGCAIYCTSTFDCQNFTIFISLRKKNTPLGSKFFLTSIRFRREIKPIIPRVHLKAKTKRWDHHVEFMIFIIYVRI